MKSICFLTLILLAGCAKDHTVTITGVVCAHCVPVKTFPVACWKTDDGKVHRPTETMQANTHYYIFIDEKDCSEGWPTTTGNATATGNNSVADTGSGNTVIVDGKRIK